LRDTARSAARDEAIDHAVLTANIVGLFTQAHDACAGLVANSLRRLARDASRTAPSETSDVPRRTALPANLSAAIAAVSDVIRLDPPVQNTRRFLHAPAVIHERTLTRGDAILVVLAAAAAGTSSDDIAWTFGHGAHGCPGRSPASTIAAIGVQAILDSDVDLSAIAHGIAYQPLGNVRIARFHTDPAMS
jgi:cytochrome P450